MPILLVFFTISYTVSLADDGKKDLLWQKASQVASENWNLIPGTKHKIKHVTDKKGNEKSHKEVIVRYYLGDNDLIVTELVSASKNGEKVDTTNKYVRDTMEDEILPTNKSLFHNNEPGNPIISRTNKTIEINGHICIGFDFIYNSVENGEEFQINGTAWLDEISGAPLRVEKSLTSLPIMVKSMTLIEDYSYDSNGDWYMIKETVASDVSLVLIKRHMLLENLYYDYWRYHDLENQPKEN